MGSEHGLPPTPFVSHVAPLTVDITLKLSPFYFGVFSTPVIWE